MRRLLQLGTLCLFLAVFLTPLSECLDCWDAPGIENDTEFALFMLVLGLALVLLVSRLLSVVAMAIRLETLLDAMRSEAGQLWRGHRGRLFFVPPLNSSPLRI